MNRPVIVASHPRSGTHLTMDLLRRQFSACEVNKRLFSFRDTPYINLDEFLSKNTKVDSREVKWFNRAKIPIIKTHRLPSFDEPFQYLNPIPESRAELSKYLEQHAFKIFVHRNIKSTMVSLYYFVPESDRGGSIHEFIRQVRGKRQLSRIGFWAYQMARWLERDDVLSLDYDELLKSPERFLPSIGSFINQRPLLRMPLLPEAPKSLLSRRGAMFFSRKPTSTAIMSYESRRYTVDSFNNEDDQFILKEVEKVAPGLNSQIKLF
nr:sulfotransferase domain-containing protein [Mariprofundus sp. KV]